MDGDFWYPEQRRVKRVKKYLLKCRLLLIPSLAGVALFYVLPYARVIYYSLIENQFSRKFVGLQNYERVFQNEYL